MRKLKLLFLFFILVISQLLFAQSNQPEWAKNATIYEVNIRQYTKEGTFKAFAEHLPRLKEMGVDILWLMPIHPIGVKNRKGELGSYYAVRDYKGINPEFGTAKDFRRLIKQIHDLDMKIILDWVANHSAPDNVWLDQCRQHWYTLDSAGYLQPTLGTDWWDVADLNYNNPEMRKEMINSLSFWVKEFDIDGFRCDVADYVPTDFWVDARKALDEIKPVFMLAEAENPEHHDFAFEMSYAWEFHHIMNGLASGEKSLRDVHEYFRNNRFKPVDFRMQFTSNHDENSWNGTEHERYGDQRLMYAALAATIEGMPLIYSGQEADFNRRLKFFDKDEIDWSDFSLVPFYTKLFQLNKNNQALWNGEHGGQVRFESSSDEPNVLVFVREKNGDKVVGLFNFSSEAQEYVVTKEFTTGNYKSLFEDDKSVTIERAQILSLQPYEFQIYYK
ncbi:MAG: alpha-glucosidase C-terminal domain-containing protein [Crocinitomicaceae bacterium]|nr:alpha-glucosidase C-terminal domain-containing protein [Crocinitomicaceae bacterium]